MNRKYEWDGDVSSLKDLYKDILLSYKFKAHNNGYLLDELYVNLESNGDTFIMQIYKYDSLMKAYFEVGNLKVKEKVIDRYSKSLQSSFNGAKITADLKTMNKYVLRLIS